jgi:hypothetical protein
MELYTRATMFKLSLIAESRRLWGVLQKHFGIRVLGWQLVQATSTSTDRFVSVGIASQKKPHRFS